MNAIKYLKRHLNFAYRTATSKKRKLPDFLIIGEAKCGTTSLFNYIKLNKGFEQPLTKEIHFFDYKFHNGINWYRSHFPLISKNKITGEATPYYFFHPKAISRIAKNLPNVKVILMVRNPVDRAISSFSNNIRIKMEPLRSFSKALAREEAIKEKILLDANHNISQNHKYQLYLERGVYYKNYERLLECFDENNILVLEFNEFFNDLPNQYGNVLKFLGLDATQVIENTIYNKGSYKNEGIKVRNKLKEFYKGHNERFFKLLGRSFDWNS